METELHLAGYREPLGLWIGPGGAGSARPPLRAHEIEFSSRGDRVTGQLILPAQGAEPFPLVIAQHALGSSAAELIDLLGTSWVEAGAALALLDFPLHGARADQKLLRTLRDGAPDPRRSALAREFAQQSLVDLERAVDALEAERAIDAKRIGYVGFGLGAQIGAAFCALDPRPAAAALALRAGAALASGPDPEAYRSRIAPRPLLLLEVPPERSAAPIWDFLATSLVR